MHVSRLSLNAALLFFYAKKEKKEKENLSNPSQTHLFFWCALLRAYSRINNEWDFFFPVLQIGVAREIWRAWDGMPAIAGCDGCILFYCYPLSPVNYSSGVFVQYSPAVLNSMLTNTETSVEKYKHLEWDRSAGSLKSDQAILKCSEGACFLWCLCMHQIQNWVIMISVQLYLLL